MSYQVLARKWRPQVFEDIVGQGHITRTLQNAITTNRLAHAFLFSGPRGVGKTTTARILAKALNCTTGPTPTPCGTCDSCREIAAGTSMDVIEIDGASNRGIEHIRELREAVKYAPSGGKDKVYVIDEVHMLTNEAFNALLKTLEEPPPHVVFIFATTEPQKIPATIHSRCQRYGFKRVSLGEITGRLSVIAQAEGIRISDAGLAMLARAAEGSMRDSQSLLDQAVSYSGLEVKDEDLQSIVGAVSQEVLRRFSQALLARDAAALLTAVDELLEQGQDLRQLLAGLVEHIRNLMIVKIAKDPGKIIELPAADLETARQQAGGADMERLLVLFDSLSKTLDEMRWSPHQRFTLEVGLVKACSLAPLKPLGEAIDRLKALEARLGSTPAASLTLPETVRERPSSYGGAKAAPAPASAPRAGGDAGSSDLWTQVKSALKARRPGLAAQLAHSQVLEVLDDLYTIGITGTTFQLGLVDKKENRDLIEQVAGEALGTPVRLRFQLTAQEKKPAAKPGSQKKTKPDVQDPLVNEALTMFGGTLLEPEESTE